MASTFPNIWYYISEKELIREKAGIFFILEPARLLGACKPGLRAAWILRPGMIVPVVTRLMVPSDSAQKWGRAGNLAGALQFFNFIPRPLPIIIFWLVFLCSCVFICHPRPHHRNPSLGLQAYSTPTICHGVPVGCISFLWLPIYLFRVLCKHAKSNIFCMLCEIFRCLFYMLIEFCPIFGVWGENFAYYSANRP